ncbi:Emc5p RNJ42_03571 [Nakaseomyces bracarensis]|uniref:Emc5p n=1 Tax=Nakaseomyces bracarensis TaxID=273131 RepID=UPI003871C7C1
MGIISKVLQTLSLIQLLHAGFSSYEFNQIVKKGVNTSTTLPLDIKFEVLCALILFALGSFLSFDTLQYYTVRGERKLVGPKEYLADIKLNKATNIDNLIGCDPNGEVSYAPSFVDVKAKREEVQKWMNETQKKLK